LNEVLTSRGFRTETRHDLAQVSQRANRWHEAGELRALVAAGGDGTAAELVNRTAPGVPLAIFPTGTENLLARHLGIRRDPQAVGQMIAAGRRLHLDAGRAGARIFLLMASAGFDADVVHRVHAARRGHIQGWRTYLGPLLQSIRSYPFPEIRIGCRDGRPETTEIPGPAENVYWFFCFNLPCYGGGFQVVDQADGADGQFDLCTYSRSGVWPGLRLAAAARLGCHRRLAGYRQYRASRVRLESGRPVPYQLDGDPGGHLPVELEVVPQRLCFLVPS
jgi:diacylglycerol kinase family enzyme